MYSQDLVKFCDTCCSCFFGLNCGFFLSATKVFHIKIAVNDIVCSMYFVYDIIINKIPF